MGYDIESMMVRPCDAVPDEYAIIEQGDTPIMTTGNISTLCGVPKCGKTFATTILIVAQLRGYCGLNGQGDDGTILLLDTEQSRADCLRVIRRIYRMMGWGFSVKHPELVMLSTREYDAPERMDILVAAMARLLPSFVLIDGFSDLIRDTNDLKESTEAINYLMKLSTDFKCHICSVLHTNPASEKVRGHAGSELQRKSESLLLVTKDADTGVVKVSPQFCRHQEFKPFSFRIDESGIPVPCDCPTSPADSVKVLFEGIFATSSAMDYRALCSAVSSVLNLTPKTAEKYITKGKKAQIIEREPDGTYHLKYTDEPSIPMDADLPPSTSSHLYTPEEAEDESTSCLSII